LRAVGDAAGGGVGTRHDVAGRLLLLRGGDAQPDGPAEWAAVPPGRPGAGAGGARGSATAAAGLPRGREGEEAEGVGVAVFLWGKFVTCHRHARVSRPTLPRVKMASYKLAPQGQAPRRHVALPLSHQKRTRLLHQTPHPAPTGPRRSQMIVVM